MSVILFTDHSMVSNKQTEISLSHTKRAFNDACFIQLVSL